MRWWLQPIAAVWAVLAGVSVTLQLGGTIALKGKSASDQYEINILRSLYVSQGGLLVGAFWLALLAMLVPGDPPQCPRKLWSTLGGIVTLPSFVVTPAAQVLGLQLVLMLVLLGMVGAALIFDCQAPRLHLSWVSRLGLVLLFFGVVLEILDAVPFVKGPPSSVALYICACLIVGVLFAVQSKMNVHLAQDLGSPFRSAAWSNTCAFAVGVWLLVGVRFGFHVQYEFKSGQWWIWLLIGLQSAFYTLTLALLPKILGYSSTFVLVLAGKLSSSAMADTLGAFQPAVPLSLLRCVSVFVMLIGAIVYNLLPSLPAHENHKKDDKSEKDDNSPKTTVALPGPMTPGQLAEVSHEEDEEEALMRKEVQLGQFAQLEDNDEEEALMAGA